MKYAVVYERGPTNWSAFVPDLPGCIGAADTLDECKRLMTEAVEFHIEGLREDGESVPAPTCEVDMVEVVV